MLRSRNYLFSASAPAPDTAIYCHFLQITNKGRNELFFFLASSKLIAENIYYKDDFGLGSKYFLLHRLRLRNTGYRYMSSSVKTLLYNTCGMGDVEPGPLDEDPPVLDGEEALASVPHVVAAALGGAGGGALHASAGFGSGFGLGGPTRGGPATQQG